MREPKKVRTNSELKKSCHGLRVHNEKLKNDIIELESKLVLHGHCPKCDGVYSRRADVGCLGCGYKEPKK